MPFIKKYNINKREDLIPLCKDILEKKYPAQIVLKGELGSGKTTFVRTLVEQTSIDTIVSSPTFTLMNSYKNNDLHINHFDLYRLSGIDEVLELGFEDFIFDCDFCFIEWPERAWELIPKPYTLIEINYGSLENERSISISIID